MNETKWLQAFADKTGFPQGIVAECHLAQPDAEAVLERHMQYANVRGVRDFGDGRYLVDPAWRAGFAFMQRHNLVSCIDTRIQFFDDLLDLAGAFPNIMICVDHCAIPEARDDDYFKRWSTAMRALARADNVVMKISGLGMMDRLWTVESIRPWVLGSIEAFGVDRVVFGSNWPVDRMFSSYPDLINAYAADHRGLHERRTDEDVLAQRREAVSHLIQTRSLRSDSRRGNNVGSQRFGCSSHRRQRQRSRRGVRFWESFLGRPATWRTILNRPYLAEIIGIPGVKIDGAFIDLARRRRSSNCSNIRFAERRANPPATANPGNVHICLGVENADAAWRRAIECGATPVRREGPVEVDDGPNRGARVAYLRNP